MLSKIRAFFRTPSPLPDPFRDEVLGPVFFNSEESVWEVHVSTSASNWKISVAGKDAPDSRLIPHARDLATNPEAFEKLVYDFLRSEASTFPEAKEEILALQLEGVALPWPARPNEGMLFFDGGKDDRTWRCDYLDRKPDGLSFDR